MKVFSMFQNLNFLCGWAFFYFDGHTKCPDFSMFGKGS